MNEIARTLVIDDEEIEPKRVGWVRLHSCFERMSSENVELPCRFKI